MDVDLWAILRKNTSFLSVLEKVKVASYFLLTKKLIISSVQVKFHRNAKNKVWKCLTIVSEVN